MANVPYTGVQNTNGNTYEVIITPQEFMQRINLDSIENPRVRLEYQILFDLVNAEDCLLEHVDTHNMPDSKDWRVQLRLRVHKHELEDRWYEIVEVMKVADPMWGKYFDVRARFNIDEFYGIVTFVVPGV